MFDLGERGVTFYLEVAQCKMFESRHAALFEFLQAHVRRWMLGCKSAEMSVQAAQ